MLGANLVILAQIWDELSHGQANFLEFEVKMTRMTLKVKVNYLNFQHQPRVSQDAYLGLIWWFQLKSVTSYLVDKLKFTDGRTGGRTDAGDDNTLSARKRKG